MKKAFLMILCSLGVSSVAAANFTDVQEVLCDGELVENTLGNRAFLDFNNNVFGLGSTENNQGEECRVVDFYMIAVTNRFSMNDQLSVRFEFVTESGRRSSCAEGVIPFEGLSFQSALYSEENQSVTLFGTDDCNVLTYKF